MAEAEGNVKTDGHEVEAESLGEPDEPSHETKDSPAVQNKTDDKVELFLKNAGDAPIMKKKKWVVPKDWTIGQVAGFIRKYLKLEHSDNLFFFVNQAFAPSPDQTCGNLHKCYGTIGADGSNGTLVLHYSKVQAWG